MTKEYVRNRNLSKFFVRQIKLIVSNPAGETIYTNAFDIIIEDLYGVRHFSRKLQDTVDDGEAMSLFAKVGFQRLLDLLKSRPLCNILRELTLCQYNIIQLRKKCKRKHRKGIRDKYLIKEYNYTMKLYRDGMKAFRKRLGLKGGKKQYKAKYANLRGLIHDDGYDYSWGGFDDFYEYDDPYDMDDDDYNDYDDDSELQDFLREVENGNQRRARRGKMSHGVHEEVDFGDFEDEFEFDDDDEDDYDEVSDAKINKLSAQLTALSDKVEMLLTQSDYDALNGRDPISHKPMDMLMKSASGDQALVLMQKQIASISDNVRDLARAMVGFQDFRTEIEELLTDMDEENDGEEEEAVAKFGEPTIQDSYQAYQEKVNMFPDLLSTPADELPDEDGKDPSRMNVGEMIDEINQSKPIEIRTGETDSAEEKQ